MVNTEMEKAHRKTQILKPCMLLWQKTLFVLDQWDVDIQSVLQADFVSVHLYVQTHHNKLNSIPKEDIVLNSLICYFKCSTAFQQLALMILGLLTMNS